MKLFITTPSKNIAQEEVDEIYATGPKGEFGILPSHANYVTPLATGPLFYKKGDKKHSFFVSGGYLSVADNHVYVLGDFIEKGEDIPLAEARAHLESLSKKLAQETLEPEQFAQLLVERDREAGRVAAAS